MNFSPKSFVINGITHTFALCLSNTQKCNIKTQNFQIMASENQNLIYVRVLQHDTEDQIRMGRSFPIFEKDIKKAVDSTIKQYDEDMAWCGGFKAGCERYYKRIALVNGETFESVAEVWNK